jgi:hypothetical protein
MRHCGDHGSANEMEGNTIKSRMREKGIGN